MVATASPPVASLDLLQPLQEIFGFDRFRPLQEEAIREALAGRDVLMVMPTGAGKSLCFQLPAALEEGVTLVVSPLIALMRDQVISLVQRTGFRQLGCASLNSLQSPEEQREILSLLRAGRLKLLYVAPERFRSAGFQEVIRSVQVARFVVDEAHCISEWGHDFRPDYLSLKPTVEALGRPPLMAVTATATPRVRQSIVTHLGLREPAIVTGGFDRPNLHFAVHRCKSEPVRQEKLARALPKLAAMGGSGLIYVATRKQCDEVAGLANAALRSSGVRAGAYHAGLDNATRNDVQQQWLNGQLRIIVATNAFGMGIDKEDVRFVVHYVYPDSLESYYQEAGRAGRDGRRSRCVVLYNFADRRTREWFIDNDVLTVGDILDLHTLLCRQGKEDNQSLPRDYWRQKLNWTDLKARLAFGEMARFGLVRVLGETADELLLQILKRDFPLSLRKSISGDLDRRREERYWRLDQITNYCKTTSCRRIEILRYFGDHGKPAHDRFCCDVCDAPPVVHAPGPQGAIGPAAPQPRTVSAGDPHSLLQALDALSPRLGKSRLNRILRGSTAQDVQNFAKRTPLFGALQGCSENQVAAWLDGLIEGGYLHQADEEEYNVCQVTVKGRAAWEGKLPMEVPLPRGSAASQQEADPAAMALFQSLRNWRRAAAVTENVPPYCVLSDRTLAELAQVRPADETALRGITGIGDAKMQRYAAELLGLIAATAEPAQEIPPPVLPRPAPSAPRGKKVTVGNVAVPATVIDTLKMLNEGRDIEAIAEARGLKSSTIWTHLEKLFAGGAILAAVRDELIPPPLFEQVKGAIGNIGGDLGIKAIWENLNGEIDYGIIRCVAAAEGVVIAKTPTE